MLIKKHQLSSIMVAKHIYVFPGTFDPFTRGHLYVAEVGSRICDELIIAIGSNSTKKTSLFTLDERLEMIQKSVEHLPNVVADHYENEFLVDYALRKNACAILRGRRRSENPKDIKYEGTLAGMNRLMEPELPTIYVDTEGDLSKIEASWVRSFVTTRNWSQRIVAHVPPAVRDIMLRRFSDH
jgi:pantetheine-phosphate adenylyltransferase